MNTTCAGCGHTRDDSELWPEWQCPACLLAYATSSKLARRTASAERSISVRVRHKKQRRRFLLLVLFFVALQVASGWLGGWFAPQLWIPATAAAALLWVPVGFFGLRKPPYFWLPLWIILSGFSIGTILSHFRLTDAIIAFTIAPTVMAVIILAWTFSGKTPKRSGRVNRQSGFAAVFAFLVCIPLVVFAQVHPAAAFFATMTVALAAGWMQFRIYRATRYHGIREAWPLASVTLLDWLTPRAWKDLLHRDSDITDTAHSNDGRVYSGSEMFGRKNSLGHAGSSHSETSKLHNDQLAAPNAGNAIDGRTHRLRLKEKPVAPEYEGEYVAKRPMRYRQNDSGQAD